MAKTNTVKPAALKHGSQRGKPKSKGYFEDGTYDIDEFHRVFIEEEDLTEYKPAIKLVGDWQLWERFKRDWPEFREFISMWKDELEVKLKSDAMTKVLEFMDSDSKQALAAARFIATKDYNRESGRGRISNKERQKEAKALAKAAGETAEETKRIQTALRLVSGDSK